MSLNIKNPATVALVDELARRRGITKTAAIHEALTERLHRLGYGAAEKERLLSELRAIRERVATLPVVDNRSDDDITGLDAYGIPN